MICGYSTSKHLIEDRSDRLMKIATTVGFGEISYKKRMNNGLHAVFTTTGIMMITDPHDTFIITMYFANIEKVAAIFKGKTPKDLISQIHKNMKKGYV